MPRAKDLDAIAPDDPIVKPTKKTKKSKDLPFRKEVYRLIKGTTKTSLSSFLARPKVFTFDNRQKGEEIILVLRRHWFTNVSWILTATLMILAPILLPIISLLDFFPTHYTPILLIFWCLITFAFAFEQFLSWYFNVFIITEERVVDIDFYNLLYKKLSEAQIDMIQDITVSQGGVSQTLFNYGTVLIQTASEIPLIKIEKIPNPNLVLKVLQQMRQEEQQEALEGRIK